MDTDSLLSAIDSTITQWNLNINDSEGFMINNLFGRNRNSFSDTMRKNLITFHGKIKNVQFSSANFRDLDITSSRKSEMKLWWQINGAYLAQLVETQDLSKVDAISGASISYWQFVETTRRAVEETGK